jgi:phosphatidylinositol alpha-mannosyltransferase
LEIALLCPYNLHRPGGVQGQVMGLARALRDLGHLATVVAPADGTDPVSGIPPDALVAVGRTVDVVSNGSVVPLSFSPLAWWRAGSLLRHGPFDVLHLHEPLAPGPGWAAICTAPQPLVGTFHRSGDSDAYRLLAPIARWAGSRLDARCAVSNAAQATATRALGGTYEIVGNGVEVERFSEAEPWPTTGPTVLFVGRHERRKGLGVVLHAYARARRERGLPPGTVLWVAGVGPETDALREQFPEDSGLAWLGRVSDEELTARLVGAHVLVAPALGGESFGVILLEAMAARTAVIASAIPGYSEVLANHGRLVPPGDVGAWAQALSEVLGAAETQTGICAGDMLDAAGAHASQWAMPRIAERYVEIYRAILDGGERSEQLPGSP